MFAIHLGVVSALFQYDRQEEKKQGGKKSREPSPDIQFLHKFCPPLIFRVKAAYINGCSGLNWPDSPCVMPDT